MSAGSTTPSPFGSNLCVGVTVTLVDFMSLQPFFVTVAVSVSVPAAPAVKVMLLVVPPLLMVPLAIDQEYVAPLTAVTEAVPLAPETMVEAVVMAALGVGVTVTVTGDDWKLSHAP